MQGRVATICLKKKHLFHSMQDGLLKLTWCIP